jgi:hypothetical protein
MSAGFPRQPWDAPWSRFGNPGGSAAICLWEATRSSKVTTAGPERPGFSSGNESFLFPTATEVRSAGPTRKSSGASPCDDDLVIATDRGRFRQSDGIGQASDPALKGQVCPLSINPAISGTWSKRPFHRQAGSLSIRHSREGPRYRGRPEQCRYDKDPAETDRTAGWLPSRPGRGRLRRSC